MKRTLEVLNELEADGLYSTWALAGAMALNRYIDPVAPHDLDITVQLPGAGLIVSLEPIYAALAARGYSQVRGEHVIVAGVAVQFIAAAPGSLADEALHRAEKATLFGVPLRVFPLAHLLAIMLQLGRPKDQTRLAMVLSEFADRVPWESLKDVLHRHRLDAKFTSFRERHSV